MMVISKGISSHLALIDKGVAYMIYGIFVSIFVINVFFSNPSKIATILSFCSENSLSFS